MFSYKYGPITNPDTNKQKDIVVNALSKKNSINIAIGLGMILMGTTYLCISMFKSGSDSYEEAELNTLESLGLI